MALAWDPHLKIAEKIAIPHHIRHGYDYPYINFAQMNRQVGQNLRQGFSQPAFEPQRQTQTFRQPAAFGQPSGFTSQPFDQGRNPVRQTRFFQMFNQSPRGFGAPGSGPSFSRRLS